MTQANSPAVDCLNKGIVAENEGQLKEAVTYYQQAIEQAPNLAEAHQNLGAVLYQKKHYKKALLHFQKVIELQPKNSLAYSNLGGCLMDLGNTQQSIDCCKKAIAFNSNNVAGYSNLGNAYMAEEEPELAVFYYIKAAELEPGLAGHWSSLAKAYHSLGRFDRAVSYYQKALTIDTECVNARFGLAMTSFMVGHYSAALENYEWRFKHKDMIGFDGLFPEIFSQQAYAGEDLKGKTILLYMEQGFGDNIQFARFIPLVLERAKSVILFCKPELKRLFESSFDFDRVIDDQTQVPQVDYHMPLLSIPCYFDNELKTISNKDSYLASITNDIDLPQTEESFKVGIVWSTSVTGFDYKNKQIPLSFFEPLVNDEKTAVYSFQLGDEAKQLQEIGWQDKVIDLSDQLKDFSDTAQVLEKMDLVISVDTAFAHLAGAMGKQVWVLLKKNPDWRWHSDGSESTWYPSARLFRQASPGRWEQVFKRVYQKLSKAVF